MFKADSFGSAFLIFSDTSIFGYTYIIYQLRRSVEMVGSYMNISFDGINWRVGREERTIHDFSELVAERIDFGIE